MYKRIIGFGCNLIPLVTLMYLIYTFSHGWNSKYFFIILSFVIAMYILNSFPLKKTKPWDKFPKNKNWCQRDAWLLTSIHLFYKPDGMTLTDIVHNGDFINRAIFELNELKKSTQRLISVSLIKIEKNKFYITDEGFEFFNNLIKMNLNPNRTSHVYYMLIRINPFNNISSTEVDKFITEDNLQKAINEHSQAVEDFINKSKQNPNK